MNATQHAGNDMVPVLLAILREMHHKKSLPRGHLVFFSTPNSHLVSTRSALMPGKWKEKKESGTTSYPNGISDKTIRGKSSKETMAVSSSLHNNHISPRTFKSPRDYVDGSEDDVELSLLGEADRQQALPGLEDDILPPRSSGKRPMSTKDKQAMVLLCVLCESHTTGWLQTV